jgi:YD repeat-containing protein
MNKRIYLVVLLAFAFKAQAQTSVYYNGSGQLIGTSTTVGNTTYYNNKSGQPVGMTTNANGTTYVNDAKGVPLGMTTSLNGQPPAAPPVSLFSPNVKKND